MTYPPPKGDRYKGMYVSKMYRLFLLALGHFLLDKVFDGLPVSGLRIRIVYQTISGFAKTDQ